MRITHIIQAVLFILASAAVSFGAAEPQYAAIAHTVGSAATALLLAVGLTSNAIGQPAVPSFVAAEPVQAPVLPPMPAPVAPQMAVVPVPPPLPAPMWPTPPKV